MESAPSKAEPLLSANSPATQQQIQPERGSKEATIIDGCAAAGTTPDMASKKRSSTDNSQINDDTPSPKRHKKSESPDIDMTAAHEDEDMVRQSPSLEELITAQPYTDAMFDTEPMRLLERSIAIVLEHVGFDGASKQAMESLMAQANSYAEHFLSHAIVAMSASRRTQPIVPDFEYALRKEGLTDHLLRPHLKPPVPKEKTQLRLELEPIREPEWTVPPGLLGEDLSGDNDKLTKTYIPKKFPAFPSKHTYKKTDVMPEREADPRKIREKATEAARAGEEALRRLVSIEKSGEQKAAAKFTDPDAKLRNELYAKAMEDLCKINPAPIKDGLAQGVIINAEKKYHRQPVIRKPS